MLTRNTAFSVLAIALASSSARAQARDAAAAEALFRQGRDLVKRGEVAEACPLFAESQRLDPGVGTLLNLAQCEEKTGKLASAWQHYQEALDQLPTTDPRRDLAARSFGILKERVPRLAIRLSPHAPADTTVTRDGIALGAAALGIPLPVDPGVHSIVASAPGSRRIQVKVTLREAETRQLELEVPRTASYPSRDGVAESGGLSLGTIGYLAGGVGIVGLGLGTFYAIRASSKNDEALRFCSGATCTDQRGVDLTDESRTAGKISIASFTVGGLACSAGAVLLIIVRKSKTDDTRRVSIAPRFGGLEVSGQW